MRPNSRGRAALGLAAALSVGLLAPATAAADPVEAGTTEKDLPEWSGPVIPGPEDKLTWQLEPHYLEFETLSAGAAFTMAIDTDGNGWGWGSNGFGQLCSTTDYYFNRPTPVLDSEGNQAQPTGLATGQMASHWLDANQFAWSCGKNTWGQLGAGPNAGEYSFIPLPVVDLDGHQKQFQQLFASDESAYGSSPNGDLWGWGGNPTGQLVMPGGLFDTRDSAVPTESTNGMGGYSQSPSTFVDVAGNQAGSIGIEADGKAWGWGSRTSTEGTLGAGVPAPETPFAPTPIINEDGQQLSFVQVQMGYNYSLALDSDGHAWAWGQNDLHQLGNPSVTEEITYYPVPVLGADGQPLVFASVHAGSKTGYGVTPEGYVYAWGDNAKGQLGNGSLDVTSSAVPLQVTYEDGTPVQAYTMSSYQDFAVMTALPDSTGHRRTWSWGSNSVGQLGAGLDADIEISATPVEVTLPQPTMEPKIYWGDDDLEGSTPTKVSEEETAEFDIPSHDAGRIPVYLTTYENQPKELIGYYTFMLSPTISVDPERVLLGETSDVTIALPEAEVPYVGDAQLSVSLPEGLSFAEDDVAAYTLSPGPQTTKEIEFDEDGLATFPVEGAEAETYDVEAQAFVAYPEDPMKVWVSGSLAGAVEFYEETPVEPGPEPETEKPETEKPEKEQPDKGATQGGPLAKTGSSASSVALVALAALGLGSGLVFAGHRRRNATR